MIAVTPTISIDDAELEATFIRSSGPGGQHVNKVATAVQLRFNVRTSPALPDDVRGRLLRLAGKHVTEAGVLIITASQFRTQQRNRQEALDRLVALIRAAAQPPLPRRPTRPTLASQQRRVERKRQRAGLKRQRGAVRSSED